MGVLEGKTAIVTGASRGIGEAIAVAFAQAGADLLITARSWERLEAVAAKVRAAGRRCEVLGADLESSHDVKRIAGEALARLGRIDVLVNNGAIIHPFVNLVDFDEAEWRRVIEVNLVAPAMLVKAVLPSMIAARSGKVINISSIGGRMGGKGRSAYRAAKAGLINFTQSAAAEVKRHGIDVNCICPGGVDTEGLRDMFGGKVDDTARLMKPEEIASVAVFLASPAASSITGTAIDAFGLSNPVFRL